MNQDDYRKLALKWAPIHYQYITLKEPQNKDAHFDTKVDLIIPVNFEAFLNRCKTSGCGHPKRDHKEGVCKAENSDGLQKCACSEFISTFSDEQKEEKWDVRKSDERLRKTKIQDLVPVAYYSIATTNSHFFIMYSFYHGHDPGKHINDMEGCMVIVERKPKEQLVGMITVAHDVFPRYSYDERLVIKPDFFTTNSSKKVRDFIRGIDVSGTAGVMEADDEKDGVSRSLTQQEASGHGLYALGEKIWWPMRIWRWIKSIAGIYPDVIAYYPSDIAEPYEINSLSRYKGMPHTSTFYYELIDITDKTNGLLHRIPKKGKENFTFTTKGKFHGNKANPPWKWFEDIDGKEEFLWDSPSEIAKKWFDPAKNHAEFLEGKNEYVKTMFDQKNIDS